MVNKVTSRVTTFMERSPSDIKSSGGEGYDYGLNMLFAFARVVGKCLQAYEDVTCEDITVENDAAQKTERERATSLGQWNRIAQHRCHCEACVHLKQINKQHLASLPLWLCEDYASKNGKNHDIKSLPYVVQERQKELIASFSEIPAAKTVQGKSDKKIEIYKAPLFCFWPQCQFYEIEKLEIENFEIENPGKGVDCLAQVKKVLNERRDDDRYEFVVSISCHVPEATEAKATTKGVLVVIIMRSSEKGRDRNHDLVWRNCKSEARPTQQQQQQQQEQQQLPVEIAIQVSQDEFFYAVDHLKVDDSTQVKTARFGILIDDGISFVDAEVVATHCDDSKKTDVKFFLPPKDAEKIADGPVAIALAQSDQVLQRNDFFHLLSLLKVAVKEQSESESGKSTQVQCNSLKYVSIVHKFKCSHENVDTTKYLSEPIDIEKLAFGCVQYLRDQSISFMSDLLEAFDFSKCASEQEKKVLQRDKDRYEACRDTIAQFVNKINIVEPQPGSVKSLLDASAVQTSSGSDNQLTRSSMPRISDGAGVRAAADRPPPVALNAGIDIDMSTSPPADSVISGGSGAAALEMQPLSSSSQLQAASPAVSGNVIPTTAVLAEAKLLNPEIDTGIETAILQR